jgi:transcriptional regulator with XRE-family HTH domain
MKTWDDIQKRQNVVSGEENSVIKTLAYLYALRLKLHISQREFAEQIGMKQPQLAKLEQLESTPSLETLNRYARGLGLQVTLGLSPLEA